MHFVFCCQTIFLLIEKFSKYCYDVISICDVNRQCFLCIFWYLCFYKALKLFNARIMIQFGEVKLFAEPFHKKILRKLFPRLRNGSLLYKMRR